MMAGVIPTTWLPYYRIDDGELVGYLRPAGELFEPVTLFGYPLASASEQRWAEEVLDEAGLRYLADRWLLAHDDRPDQVVVIVEVDAERMVVANADFAQVIGWQPNIGDRIVLDVPTNRLRPGTD